MRNLRHLVVLAFALLMISASCGRHGSPPSSDTEVLTGTERFGWDQKAADRAELSRLHYAMYVDGNRVELSGVTCSDTPGPAGFSCACPLPKMSPGPHSLQVAAYIRDGATVKESSRSSPVKVVVR